MFDITTDKLLTIEWPKYSAALSEMYNNFPVCVVIIINPLRPCKKQKNIVPLVISFSDFILLTCLKTNKEGMCYCYIKKGRKEFICI